LVFDCILVGLAQVLALGLWIESFVDFALFLWCLFVWVTVLGSELVKTILLLGERVLLLEGSHEVLEFVLVLIQLEHVLEPLLRFFEIYATSGTQSGQLHEILRNFDQLLHFGGRIFLGAADSLRRQLVEFRGKLRIHKQLEGRWIVQQQLLQLVFVVSVGVLGSLQLGLARVVRCSWLWERKLGGTILLDLTGDVLNDLLCKILPLSEIILFYHNFVMGFFHSLAKIQQLIAELAHDFILFRRRFLGGVA